MAAAGLMLDFELPPALEATAPPEARGLRRDAVRLLVSSVGTGAIAHARFFDLPQLLSPGDLLVVNTSGTLNAALPATTDDGREFELHLSTQLPGGFWSVELRVPGAGASLPYRAALSGVHVRLPAGGEATLLAPYPSGDGVTAISRLWLAALSVPGDLIAYLERHGSPIRYKYVPQAWPLSMYQTVFASEPGSAEMPSAGRPFTPELLTALAARGVEVVPLLLHTGVASLEDHEPPYEEFFRVSRPTADRVNAARVEGRRIIAVGTTVVRALESVTDERNITSPGEGWTGLVISDDRPVRAVNGIITGLHEPRATHLTMLEQVIAAALRFSHREQFLSTAAEAGLAAKRLERAYAEAIARGYLWHEFGDAHLIMP